MATIYILYSATADKFYIGSCKVIDERISQHLSKHFGKAYTSQATDWEVYFLIENLTYEQARRIEIHIKRMKSRKYIQNLKNYPELVSKLISRYNT